MSAEHDNTMGKDESESQELGETMNSSVTSFVDSLNESQALAVLKLQNFDVWFNNNYRNHQFTCPFIGSLRHVFAEFTAIG